MLPIETTLKWCVRQQLNCKLFFPSPAPDLGGLQNGHRVWPLQRIPTSCPILFLVFSHQELSHRQVGTLKHGLESLQIICLCGIRRGPTESRRSPGWVFQFIHHFVFQCCGFFKMKMSFGLLVWHVRFHTWLGKLFLQSAEEDFFSLATNEQLSTPLR